MQIQQIDQMNRKSVNDLAIYQLVVDIYKFPKHLYSGLLMALA